MSAIAVDLDDSLYPFGELAREVMSNLAAERNDKTLQRGAYAEWNEWRTPPDIVGIDQWLEVIDICHSPENILSRKPFDYAAETVTDLVTQGHEIIYISNRAESTFDATSDWLSDNGFPAFGALVCTTKSKSEYITDCRYLIDDRPKTLIEFVYDYDWKNFYGSKHKPRVGFGLHMNYNSSLTDIPGIKLAPNWKLLRRFLVKEGLLPLDNLVIA